MLPSNPGPVKVLMIDDHADYRNGVSYLLNEVPGFTCVACESAEEAFDLPPSERPDVILMDIHLPGIDGITNTRLVKRRWPAAHVIMCTVSEDDEKIFRALRSGAVGYLLKRAPIEELRDAIYHVLQGGSPISPAVARRVINSFQIKSDHPQDTLTVREQEVLDAMAVGMRDKEIAARLQVSINTVRTHVRHIYEKLHVQGRVEAVNKVRKG